MAGRHPNPKPGCHPQLPSLPHSPLQGPLRSPLTNPRASAFSRPQDRSPAKGICHLTCLLASNLITLSEPASMPKWPCHSLSSMASPPLQPGQKTTRVRPALAVRVLPSLAAGVSCQLPQGLSHQASTVPSWYLKPTSQHTLLLLLLGLPLGYLLLGRHN